MLKQRSLYGYYLQQSKQLTLWSPEETVSHCIEYYHRPTIEKLTKIFKQNIPLVLHYLKAHHCQNDDDFVAEGMMGLLYGIKKYNPMVGCKFSTYVSFWIKACILNHFEKNFYIYRANQSYSKLFYNLNKEIAKLEASGQEVSSEILANNLGQKPEDVETMRAFLQKSVSLNSMIGNNSDDETKSLIDILVSDDLTPDRAIEQDNYTSVLEFAIKDFTDTLTEIEAKVFRWRLSPFEEEKVSFRDLGYSLGISYEMVRIIQNKIQLRLKKFLQQRKLV